MGLEEAVMDGEDKYTEIVELAKRRGFFWPSYEIYGGVAGFYDMGPLGAALKRRLEAFWREWFIRRHQDMVVEIETPVIAPARVFEASGHVESFTDPIVECTRCGRLFRADHLVEETLGVKAEGLSPEELEHMIRENNIRCPVCGGDLGGVRLFNLLFKTTIGPYTSSTGYLRPETAQGMFVSFKRVHSVMRNKIPLGIAQIGRVARNEISPRQLLLRMREFTIMEIEFFFDPEEDYSSVVEPIASEKLRILSAGDKERGVKEPSEYTVEEALRKNVIIHPWMAYWMYEARRFLEELGVPYEKQFFDEKLPEERAHYASQTFDQMVWTERWGWIEVSGHAYRGDYDLSRHMKYSGQDLTVFKPYEKPIKRRILRIRANKAAIGSEFRSDTPSILAELSRLKPEEVREALNTRGYVEVAGHKLTSKHLSLIEEEVTETGKRYIPHVVEPSFGAERLLYVVLEYAYTVKKSRVVLRLPRRLAPIQVVVLPLVANHEEIVNKALQVKKMLDERGFTLYYDESGSIGARYARADEIGVPYAVTVDHQTLEDNTVTVRDRDTWEQERISISVLPDYLEKMLSGKP